MNGTDTSTDAKPGLIQGAGKSFAAIMLAEVPIGVIPFVAPVWGSVLCCLWIPLLVWIILGRRTTEEMFVTIRRRSGTPSRSDVARIAVLATLFGVACVTLQVLYSSVVLAQEPIGDLERSLLRPGGWIPLLLAVVILSPFAEEASLRGYLQDRFEGVFSLHAALLAGALFFALLHFSAINFPVNFVVGWTLGYAMWRTGTIWTSVAMHAAANLAVGIAAVRLGVDVSPAQLPARLGSSLGAFALVAAGLVALIVWLLSLFPSRKMACSLDRLPITPANSSR